MPGKNKPQHGLRPRALVAGAIALLLLSGHVEAQVQWMEGSGELPGREGLQAHVQVLAQSGGAMIGESDMRPLGEPRIEWPLSLESVEPRGGPQPATVALAGVGLATILTGRVKRSAIAK